MLKKVAVLFAILGSSVFAQWEKEYVTDDFGNPTKAYYLVHKSHDDSLGMLVTKSNVVVQLNERGKQNLYTSSLINEIIKVRDEKGEVHNVDTTILLDLDNATPYAVIINRKNTSMIDLMKNNETLIFELGKIGNSKEFKVSFHDFDKVYEEARACKFMDKK